MTVAADAEFSPGRVFRCAGESWGRNWPALLLIAAGTATAPELAVTAIAWRGPLDASLLNLLLNLASATFGLVGTTASMLIVLRDLSGDRVAVGQALSFAVRNFFGMLGVSFLAGLGQALGFLLLVVPGLYLFTIWFVALPARIAEGPGKSALERSAKLTEGRRWQVFAVAAVVMVATALATGVIYASGEVLPKLLDNTLGAGLAAFVISPAANLALTLLSSVIAPVVYHELRYADGSDRDATASVFD